MWDGWEKQFDCLRRPIAELRGYRRTFNKASTANWGTKGLPCPTLNLESFQDGICKGIAFEFQESQEVVVRNYLAGREGKGFPLEAKTIYLEDDTEVQAWVPLYNGKNSLQADVTQKAQLASRAIGTNGPCKSYIKEIAEMLETLGINDPAVSELWRAVQTETLKILLVEIRDGIKLLESYLARRIDGYTLSPESKLPMKAMVYREVLAWRMAELSSSALENLEKENLASSIILIRSAIETTAGLWYLGAKLDDAVTRQLQGDIDEYLMKLLMGHRLASEFPQAINVLTFVDRVNKDIEGFREQYDNLSEFVHPNWAGTSLLYSKPDLTNLWTDFGKNIRSLNNIKQVGALNLSVALKTFERTYNEVAELMPAFILLCSRPRKETGAASC
jgi:cation transport protein ChaC